MDSRKVFLLVGALVVAAVAALFARSLVAGAAAPQAMAIAPAAAPVDGPMVLVATRALPVGTILDATALKFQPWPKELVDGAYYLQASTNLQSLQGTVVRNAITAGQPVTQGALVKPGDRGFLAAALGPGMRAVTFPVDIKTAVAGFVFPGDRVDLVLTQSVPGGGDGPPLKTSETIVRNLRVLATDQRSDNTPGEDGKTHPVSGIAMVTVEATPKIAEDISVAQTVGSLSLSLRPLADDSTQLAGALASGAIKAPGDPKAGASGLNGAALIQFATQPQAGNNSFVTGADVSRFQRSSVPGKGSGGGPGGAGPASGLAASPSGDPVGPVVRVARGSAVSPVVVAPAPAPAPTITTTTKNITCSHDGCSSVATSTIGGN